MPNYIDLFGIQLENKREKFKTYLTEGIELKYLKKEYKEQFDKHFHDFKKISRDINYQAIAIDASGNKREFSNGIYFYMNRVAGVINNGIKLRELETDVFSITGPERMAETYIGWKAETLEFYILKKYLELQTENSKEHKIVFIDGSLYSRMMHPIIESTVKDDEYYILKYLDLYCDILKEARMKNIILIGLSKDSRASYFRNGILDEIFYEERDLLKNSFSKNEMDIIKGVIKGIDNPDEEKIQKFNDLVKNHPQELKKMNQIFNEYKIMRTDGEIFFRFGKNAGFSHPMELGLGRPFQQILFSQLKSNLLLFVQRQFRKVISNFDDQQKSDFNNYASVVLNKLFSVPTFISFHLLPDIRDNPIKVDIPSWHFQGANLLSNYPFVDFVKNVDPLLIKIIGFLLNLYGGIENYNLLLSAAHDNAVLKVSDFIEIYEKLIQDKLGILLPLRRRTKRFWK
ncbi:MAG: DNA double-strand break repair nuclease NurA [Promethearchaeota archaeon]|nr:MAG: DNA double-strand break repair nuclease NurA [Candidatus Lokiarchaeota archaeon]